MKRFWLAAAIGIIITLNIRAQIGTIDPDFILGTGFGPDQWTGRCETIIQQNDGKLLVGGQFTEYNGQEAVYITRLNLDGSLDAEFQSPFVESWGYNIRTMALQEDGKILVGGAFEEIDGVSRNRIARLNADGSLDLSFDPSSGFNQEVTALAIQDDGKILVGGLFTVYDFVSGGTQIPANGVARLNVDGSFDSSFNIGTGFSGSTGIGQRQIHKFLVQSDGKILVGGHFSLFNNQPAVLLVRLNSDGSRDDSFDADGNFSPAMDGFYGQVYEAALLPDGKIIIGGNYGNNVGLAFGVDRLNADGSIDDTFNITHSFSNIRCAALAVQSDGKVLAGNVNFGQPSEAFVVERYNTDGSLDEEFPQTYLNNDVREMIVQADGNVTFVGYFNYNPTGIMRLIGDAPVSSVNGPAYHMDFQLYPNPANDKVKIEGLPFGAVITILDITGNEVLQFNAGYEINELDLGPLANGIYLITATKDGISKSSRLVLR